MLNWYTDITNDNFENLDGHCPHTVNPDFTGTGKSVRKITKRWVFFRKNVIIERVNLGPQSVKSLRSILMVRN